MASTGRQTDWRPSGDPTPTNDPTSLVGIIGHVPDGRPPHGSLAAAPQAFLVRMHAERPSLGVHFHTVDQFQIFCFGTAGFGRHDARVGTVHYADRLTPYGPLTPGASGVSFLTLRAIQSSGAYFMPSSRALLADQRRTDTRSSPDHRNVTVQIDADPAPSLAGSTDWIDERHDADGLRIARIALGPGDASDPIVIDGIGAFVVVIRGGIVADTDGALDSSGAGSLRWVEPGSQISVLASTDGADVVVVQFPRS